MKHIDKGEEDKEKERDVQHSMEDVTSPVLRENEKITTKEKEDEDEDEDGKEGEGAEGSVGAEADWGEEAGVGEAVRGA